MQGTLRVTGDSEADDLVSTDPFALLVAMILDQQVPLEWAFRGPHTLRQRLGFLDAERVSTMDVEHLVVVACQVPAIHRYPAVMAQRVHAVAVRLVEEYSGDAQRIWEDAENGQDLYRRLIELPGFGDEKAKILIAVLAKRFDIRPQGWEIRSAPFSDSVPRSAADIDGPDALAMVRDWKRAQRAVGKSKQD